MPPPGLFSRGGGDGATAPLASSSSSSSLAASVGEKVDERADVSTVIPEAKRRAIVVGGGPVGLAAALVLADPPHSYDVTVFESTSGDVSSNEYDATRAFLYNVNARGQVLTKAIPEVQRRLEDMGVPGFGRGFVEVPADPTEAVKEPLTVVPGIPTKGDVDDDGNDEDSAPAKTPSYWIPRHDMTRLMYEVIQEREEGRHVNSGDDRGGGGGGGSISYIEGKKCVEVNPVAIKDESNSDRSAQRVEVTVVDTDVKGDGDGAGMTTTSHVAELVVGCDGWKSEVRDRLLNGGGAFSSWHKYDPKKFRVRGWNSPATDLRIKVLQFPPRFEIPDASAGGSIRTQSDLIYVFRSTNSQPLNSLSLGALPMKDDDKVRPFNVITRPNHEIWGIDNAKDMREWLKKAFPRLPLDDGSVLSDEELERFAKARGTRFPPCQYSPGLAAYPEGGECGVALCGDSAHAFPPDIGQGINSGLTDVVALDRALRGADMLTGEGGCPDGGGKIATGGGVNYREALGSYQRVREPEVRALIRLARFGSPYQYRQPLRLDRIGRKLYMANVALRLVLNKLTFGLIPPHCFFLAMDPNMTFQRIMRRSDLTAAGLTMAAMLAVVKITAGRSESFRGLVSAACGLAGRALISLRGGGVPIP